MSIAEGLVAQLQAAQKFFKTTASVFEPADAGFAPDPELYTVAGHIAHTADSIDWFVEGALGSGWDMEFDKMIAKARAVTSLEEANAWLDRSFENAIAKISRTSEADLMAPIDDDRIMPGAPRAAITNGIADHTAHHRGSLAVYARLLGKVPPMVYS